MSSTIPCPAFTLPMTNGKTFDSAQQPGTYVLYCYPKDDTPGCTTESSDFRDYHASFMQANCAIFGLSRDSISSHTRFQEKLQLPFSLISDPDEIACTALGIMTLKNMYGKQVRGIERSTFIIHNTHIVKAYRGVKVPGHVQEVLAFVQTL